VCYVIRPIKFKGNGVAARGLKSKIAINVAILLLLSAMVTDILIVVVIQNIMARDKVAESRQALERAGHLYFSTLSDTALHADAAVRLVHLFRPFESRFSAIGVWDHSGTKLYHYQEPPYVLSLNQFQRKEILTTQKAKIDDLGRTWSIFWWHSRATAIAVPVLIQGQPAGVVAAIVPLTPIFDQLRGYHKAIFLYIIINTCILTIVGLYRIFRLYLNPIDRIVKQADGFNEDDDPFFAFRQEDNELNRLSLSLNRMLSRISSDKKKLQKTVSSLEKANQELQIAQREIIRAEKLASVGRLAAGIAHEIGNPIGIVLGYLDLLKQNDLEKDDRADFLQRTETEVQRINSIIGQLLDLARSKEVKPRPVALHPVIEEIAQVMRVQPVMTDIAIELALSAETDIVWGNDDQLRQVFLNLFLNAADAIRSRPDGGSGTIRVRTAVLKDDPAKNARIQICVSDNGPGIDAQQMLTIFDPFYTTKEPGKGTGLGLAVSYMITDGMGGRITADSVPGQGATFTITLRLAAPEELE